VRFHRRSASGAWPDFRCTWVEEAVLCYAGKEALERQLALGLPGFEPGILLEMPLGPALGKQARLRLRFDLGEPAPAGKTTPAGLPHEALDLAFRLLPGLVFAPQLGGEGNPGPQRLLWKYGVSGDDPILLSELPEDDGERDLLLKAKRCLASSGIDFDLVFLSRDEARLAAFQRWGEEHGLIWGGHCGVHLAAETPESVGLFQGMCSARMDELPERRTEFPIWGTKQSWPLPGGDIQYDWGEDTFRLHCRGGLPAVRWSIPLTNGSFGYLAMETGGGYLWSGNARLFQITPWDNDPWAAEGPEQLILCQGGREISLFAARDGYACDVTFGPGYLKWEKQLEAGAAVTLTAFVPPDRNERIFLLEAGTFPPDAVLLWRLKPQLGEHLTQGLWVRASEDKSVVWLKNPVSERAGISLYASVPWRRVRLPEGRRRTVEFTIPLEGALVLQAGEGCPPLTPEEAKTALASTVSHWRSACGALRVQTPDSALNHYLSFWSQYQIQASRMLARTSVYQCGGAYGFRDQLQDACALLRTRPELAKRQILRCCGHQFEEGDVLHWWHEPPGGGAGAGVRTRMTDDLLWLPYAVSVWWEETGDRLLLEETVTYLTGERLAPQERDRYFAPNAGRETESVYRHCVRALECMLGRGVGEHGLCRVGGGDWNDGMDRVGAEGRGESVWLSWFAALVLRRFAQVCDDMSDRERGDRYRGLAQRLARAAEGSWDGAWYLRGWFDSGHPLGGRNCPECQIDSLAQSFAVFAGGDPARTERALESAESLLLHPREQTLGLLFPAFDFQGDFPGYIANYRPGARENGGQYTHAAVWMAQAWLKLGNADRGWALLQALLPECHPIRRYRGEPFVLAGDVSLEPGKEGTAGWTWYTGAAGWYDRAAVQDLLGIRFRKGLLHLEPCLPSQWEGYQAQLSLGSCRLSIEVVRSGVERLTLDGTMIPQGVDCTALSGQHQLRLEILRKMGCGPEENHV